MFNNGSEDVLIPVIFNDDSPETTASSDLENIVTIGQPVSFTVDWNANLGADQISDPDAFILDANILSIYIDANGDLGAQGGDGYETRITSLTPLVYSGDATWKGSYTYDINGDGKISANETTDYQIKFIDSNTYEFSTVTYGITISSTLLNTNKPDAGGPVFSYDYSVTEPTTGLIFSGSITALSYFYNNTFTQNGWINEAASSFNFWSPTGPTGQGIYSAAYDNDGDVKYTAGSVASVSGAYSVNNSTAGIGIGGNNVGSITTSGGGSPLYSQGLRFDPDNDATSVLLGFKPTGATAFGAGSSPSQQDTLYVTVYGSNYLQDSAGANSSILAKYQLVVSSVSGDYLRVNSLDVSGKEVWTAWNPYSASVNLDSTGTLTDYTGGSIASGYSVGLLGSVEAIDYVDVTAGYNYINGQWYGSSFKILTGYSLEISDQFADPTLFNFEVITTDSDGDQSSADFSVAVQPAYGPVVLDFNGDGQISYLSLSLSQVHLDVNLDGALDHTAWVGSADALLAYDVNMDHVVNGSSEFVFSSQSVGLTDLGALRTQIYDTNQDGVLDSNDESYAHLGVWVDSNSDGVSDPGEFQTLHEAGITSISLVAQDSTQVLADGSVAVLSEGSFTWADGTTGLLHDAALSFVSGDPVVQETQLSLVTQLDSDGNSILDASDSYYDSSSLWQDLNQDGIVSDGELISLHDSHIQSIDLTEETLVATSTDTHHHLDGAATVTYDDGSSAMIQDLHLAALIDHVIADPAVLDASAPDPTAPALDTTLSMTTDLSHTVDTFLATEPVTDSHLATYEQDVNLSTDPTTPHDTASTTDTTTTDIATTTDASVYDPTHDSTVYDPMHDTVIHDTTTYDHVV